MGSSWPITAVTSEDRFSSLWDRCPGCHASFLFAVTKLLNKKQLEGFSLCTVWGSQSHHSEEDMAAGRESVGREREAGWSHCIFSPESELTETRPGCSRAKSTPTDPLLGRLCMLREIPAAFSHSATSWGPSAQTHEHMGDGSHLYHGDCPLSSPPIPIAGCHLLTCLKNNTQFCDLARFLGCKFL